MSTKGASTATTAFTGCKISLITPLYSLATSESTLSVATSTTASSAATVSPSFFNHWVMVASETLSPIAGNTS